MSLGRLFLFATSFAFALATVAPSSLSDTEIAPARHAIPRAYSRIVDAHADVCLANEQQCLQGCAGATSCSNQCQVNYQACMAQGQ
jgi:hypothetical protein